MVALATNIFSVITAAFPIPLPLHTKICHVTRTKQKEPENGGDHKLFQSYGVASMELASCRIVPRV
jgi:hypothetical protein